MTYLNLEKISKDAYSWHKENPPLTFLFDKLNCDLGGTLSLILCDYPAISQIEYEIIKLKVFNKLMER